MKNSLFLFLAVMSICCKNKAQAQTNLVANESEKSSEMTDEQLEKAKFMENALIYKYIVADINGKEFAFEKLKGKKIMIVNTASKCGYTPQYADLQSLYDKFKDQNFVVIGFPANNFGKQEPGTNEEIVTFCSKNYGVTFPMMSKVSVSGDDMAEIYKFLTMKSINGLQDSKVEWNFQKYLIDEKGNLSKVLSSKVKPMDDEILKWINN